MKNVVKYVNIFLNIAIVMLIIYIVVILLMNIKITSKTSLEDFNGDIITSYAELYSAHTMVERYVCFYKEGLYENFDGLLDSSIQKNESVYKKITEKVEDVNLEDIFIHNVEKESNNNYLIEYSLNQDSREETMLVNVNENQMTYIIYYDSMLERY